MTAAIRIAGLLLIVGVVAAITRPLRPVPGETFPVRTALIVTGGAAGAFLLALIVGPHLTVPAADLNDVLFPPNPGATP